MVLKVGSLNNNTCNLQTLALPLMWANLPRIQSRSQDCPGVLSRRSKGLASPSASPIILLFAKSNSYTFNLWWGSRHYFMFLKEHIWTHSTADLPQAFSKETVSVITPGSGVWAKLRGRREAANGAEKGRCPAQSAPSVTAEQGDFFQAVPRIKAELPSPWVRSWAELGGTESNTKGKIGATMQSHPKAQKRFFLASKPKF